MKHIVIHKAETRGHANLGWLNSFHSFSFSSYYNPNNIHFGALRVLNDDTVTPGMGFGRHPHNNMEIISIPLEGSMVHKDSMNNVQVIKSGDIQAMSAGTGIEHSEFNASKTESIKFLQIWIIPNQLDVKPRYDQITLQENRKVNVFHQIISPNKNDEGIWIHQNAWFHLGTFDVNKTIQHQFKDNSNGIYAFIIHGKANINGAELNKRDGIGLWNIEKITIDILEQNTKILLMEVPMIELS